MAEGGQPARREVLWKGVADRYGRAKLAQAYGLLASKPAPAQEEPEVGAGAVADGSVAVGAGADYSPSQ